MKAEHHKKKKEKWFLLFKKKKKLASLSFTPKRSLVVKTLKASLVLNLRNSAFMYKPDKTLAISPNVKNVLNITILKYNKDIFKQRTRENKCTKLLFYNKLLFSLIHTVLYHECLPNESL